MEIVSYWGIAASKLPRSSIGKWFRRAWV